MAISVLPFGHGVRMCLGRKVGENTMFLMISRILQEFQLHGVNKTEYVTRLVGVPLEDIKIRFEPLEKPEALRSETQRPETQTPEALRPETQTPEAQTLKTQTPEVQRLEAQRSPSVVRAEDTGESGCPYFKPEKEKCIVPPQTKEKCIVPPHTKEKCIVPPHTKRSARIMFCNKIKSPI